MLAMGPRVLNSAPYSPCWYTKNFFLQSDACHGSQGREFCTLQPLLVEGVSYAVRARCARGACAVRVLGLFRRPFHPEPISGNGNASRAHQVPFTTPLPVDHLRGKLFKYLTRCGRGARAVHARSTRGARAVRILPRTLGIFFFSLMLAMGPRVVNSTPCSPCWYTRNFFF